MENNWITKPICPKCNSSTPLVKNGFIFGKQRFKCRSCGLNFVFKPGYANSIIPPSVDPERFHKDRLAIHLFVEGCSYSRIAQLLSMSRPAVVRFLKPLARSYKYIRNEEKIYSTDLSKGFLKDLRKPAFPLTRVPPGVPRFLYIPFQKRDSSKIVIHQEVVFNPRLWDESDEYDHDEDELEYYKKEDVPPDDLDEECSSEEA